MGLTFANLEISPDRSLKLRKRVRLLVDSGADYSVIPTATLATLGVEPYRTVSIGLADGSVRTRAAGDVYFSYHGEKASSPVIFGEEHDEPLLGVVTLETLGFMLDPLQRRILRRERLRG